MVSLEKRDGRPTILVAEDDTGLRDIVVEILEASGYDVVPADDGRQAIEYLSSADEAPAAVLLDLMMPICSGWDCLRARKADDRLAYIPVVVMSELEMSELERAPAGADLFLRKPFHVDELIDTIDHFAHTGARGPRLS